MRLTPLVAWLPRRSRKLLPRLVTVCPAEMSELMIVIPGVGVGWGEGNSWALAGEAAAKASAMAIAMARTTLRPAPVSPACKGRDAPRMNSQSHRELRARTPPDPCHSRHDLPPLRRERQSL